MADGSLSGLRETYARDGVVFLPRALDAAALADCQAAYDWSLAHPGPGASRIPQTTSSTFYQDLYNPDCLTGYRAMLEASPIPPMMADLWGTPDVWFMYEQVFLKEGGDTRRTPWHQDSSYLAVAGQDLAVAWITFDPVADRSEGGEDQPELSPEQALEGGAQHHRSPEMRLIVSRTPSAVGSRSSSTISPSARNTTRSA